MGRVAPFRPVKRTSSDRGGRTYETPDGKFPSVTTILQCVGKPALINWAAAEERKYMTEAAADLYMDLPVNAPKMSRMGFVETLRKRLSLEKAGDKKKREAAEIGTAVHAMIEAQLRREIGQIITEEPILSAEAAFAYSQWQEWRDIVNLEPEWMEFTVWSSVFGYAGSLDTTSYLTLPTDRELVKRAFRMPSDTSLEAFFQQYAGCRLRALLDYKITKRIYLEHLFQVPAYRHAYQEMGHGAIPLGVIVHLPKTPDDTFYAVPLVDTKMDYYFAGFTHVIELFKYQRGYDIASGWIKEAGA